jgi:hypothetical protein
MALLYVNFVIIDQRGFKLDEKCPSHIEGATTEISVG